VFVSKRTQECNYLQAMEGGIDTSHVSFVHKN
jgi:phenylpropionate dioxygenase-like ring-hydroxylating dioxygenase large terminal subunit